MAMTETTIEAKPVTSNAITWLGLFISLFGMLVVRQAFRAITPEPGTVLTLARESCMFLLAGGLIWLVRSGEGLPLTSIGIGTSPMWKSLMWGVLVAVAYTIPAAVIASVTRYGHSEASQAFAKLPLWVITIVVVRAGVVEELFYRGYALERLPSLGMGRLPASANSVAIFGLGHRTGGAANVLIALVVGAILNAFYQFRRDLVANMKT